MSDAVVEIAAPVGTEPEPTGWRRRADFACASKHCKTPDGEAMVYELPVDATHCPKGHKRLMRLFNAVGVIGTRNVQPDGDWRLTSSSKTVVKSALLDPYAEQADKTKLQDPRMRSFDIKDAPAPVRALAQATLAAQGVKAGKGEPMKREDVAKLRRTDPHAFPVVLDAQARMGHAVPSLVRER